MLKITHLTKEYPGTEKGVKDLSLHVVRGDIFAFIGQNGAGKTTTLRAIAGIHPYDAGEISVDGFDLAQDPLAVKGRMAYIPDTPALPEYLTGSAYLSFIADVFRISAKEREMRTAEYASRFEMQEALGDLISSYSHGMKQKLSIIAAFLHSPRLLVLDEPFVGLDPRAAATLKGMMRELAASGGAVFFSTHVLDTAERLCDKVGVIRDGRLILNGAMADLLSTGATLEEIFLEVADGDA